MAYTLKQRLVPDGMSNNPNSRLLRIAYITIHTTGNYATGATAKMHADYQYGGSGGGLTSWHYTADADEVWQSFEDNRACWHSGGATGNNYSIAIEICVNDKTRFAEACDNAAVLTADLLNKHGLTPADVVQHNFWSGKNCPAELRSGAWGVTWEQFIMKVKGFFARAATLAAFESLAVEPPVPDWQAAALDKLVADGVINTPEYWRPRLGQPVTAGEMFAVLAKL